MRALLLKDYYITKSFIKNLLFITLIFGLVAYSSKSFSTMYGMLALIALTSVNSFTFDKQTNWNSYDRSLPITKKMIVQSKYLASLGLTVIAGVFIFTIATGVSLASGTLLLENLIGVILGIDISLLLLSLLIPLIYKFGAEKARLFLMGAAVGIVALSMLFFN